MQKPKANGLSLTLIAEDLRRLVEVEDISDNFLDPYEKSFRTS